MNHYHVRSIALVSLLATILLATPLRAETLSRRVVGVTDGDTLTLLVDEKDIRIRLHGIDTPERGEYLLQGVPTRGGAFCYYERHSEPGPVPGTSK